MLIKMETLQRIKAGEITHAFRSWVRPTVKTGSRLRTAIGVIEIEDVREVLMSDLIERDASQAGHASLNELVNELMKRPDGTIYRILLRFAGPDDRKTLAQDHDLSEQACNLVLMQLRKIDRGVAREGWALKVLELIAEFPGVAAKHLAERMLEEKTVFKTRVRRLKELGLTESLKTGYQLSPRGQKTVKTMRVGQGMRCRD
jgi:DNA-binding Lrp family transcriptional regulator